MTPPPPALLIASSHVARGTVGLRAAVHAAEALGHPTWSVPTVHLPWHPGRGPGTRAVWSPETFAAYVGDLARSPRLGEVSGMLTGYLGHPAQAEALAGLVAALRRANPAAIVVCDPVIGGERGLYVPVEVAEAIRDRLVPPADIVTPNRHELAWLVGADAVPPDNAGLIDLALGLAGRSHAPDPRILVTSAHAGSGRTGNLLVARDGATLAAHAVSDAPNSGTGDLTAALLLARLLGGDGHGAGPGGDGSGGDGPDRDGSARDGDDALALATASVSAVMALADRTGADELPLERARDALVSPDAATVELIRLA